MEERLQKILSRHGVASRRSAEKLLAEGRVTVNGAVAALGETADDETDEIAVDGVVLTETPKPLYLMLNKPRGYVTTLNDEQGRRMWQSWSRTADSASIPLVVWTCIRRACFC